MNNINLLRLITKKTKGDITSIKGNDAKLVFILSCGRTGTTFLADFYNEMPDIEAVHEPDPSWLIRMWSRAYLNGAATEDELKNVLYTYTKKRYDNISAPIYIESNPMLVGFSSVINEMFDDPIIIHMVRDPRDYVKSAVNYGNAEGLKLFFNKFVPFWFTDVEDILNFDADGDMSLLAAGYWRVVNDHINKNLSNGKNYHLLKFEDVFSGEKDEFPQVDKIIGTKSKKTQPKKKHNQNKSHSKKVASWKDWDADQATSVHEVVSPLMEEFGYGQEDIWLKKIN